MFGLSGNQTVVTRERRRFGREVLFEDHTELMVSVHPSSRLRTNYILRNPINMVTQESHQMALSEMVTENVTLEHRGMVHYEGGWPKDINMNDEEQTLRHRKKVEREDTWGGQVKELIIQTNIAADQNNAVNVYYDYFANLGDEADRDIMFSFRARPVKVFRDIWKPLRLANSVDWMPNAKEILTLFSNMNKLRKPKGRRSFQHYKTITDETNFGTDMAFYIWDAKSELRPTYYYDSTDVICRARICQKDETRIAGGSYNGKVSVWETYEPGACKGITPLESAHRERVTSVCWVSSKSNTEFYTGSLDGGIKYWDTRNVLMFSQELLLEPNTEDKQNRSKSHGIMALEFEYTIPVRFVMASDMGCIFIGNRKGLTPSETLINHFKLLSGPIRTVNRNPFFVKNFLICGDWRARIWCEEIKESPSTFYIKKKAQVMGGCWSTGRCSLFVTYDKDGNLDFWDLLLSQRCPVYSIHYNSRITDVRFRPGGDILAVSLASGYVPLLRMDDGMRSNTSKEKALIAALFEREILRSKILEARMEEIKLKTRQASIRRETELLAAAEQKAANLGLDPDSPQQFIQMIEQDSQFHTAMNDFQEISGAIEKKYLERKSTNQRTIFEIVHAQNLLRFEVEADAVSTTTTIHHERAGHHSKGKGKA